ncbi:MAG: ABC transporter permease [Acidobacteriota bacterium]
MRAYLELTKIDLRLALRDKGVLFFSYLFPLLFFFAFAEFLNTAISHVVSMVLLMGILGNGLFGAGMRTVHDREDHILRRFKVAPISSTHLLVASLITGWILYIPVVLLIVGLAHFVYGMPFPERLAAFSVILTVGLVAFRALGLILAAVANSMQEVNILVQFFYSPMLFLSGALFPIAVLPHWVQLLSQYLPATYLVSGIQGVFLRNQSLGQSAVPVLALAMTVVLGLFISAKLFRWEKQEKVPASAKAWVLAVLAPFLILGTLQLYSKDELRKAHMLYRELRRSESILIEDARIFIGDGKIIERGSVLIQNGRIARVAAGGEPVGQTAAIVIPASGKTLLPGLIDTFTYAASVVNRPPDRQPEPREAIRQALASQLYCGVTAVRAVDVPVEIQADLRESSEAGEFLGAELFMASPAGSVGGLGEGSGFLGPAAGDRGVADCLVFQVPAAPRRPFLAMLQALANRGRQQGAHLLGVLEGAGSLGPALSLGLQELVYPYPRELLPQAGLEELVERSEVLSIALAWPEAALQLSRHDAGILEHSLVQQVVGAADLDYLRGEVRQGRLLPAEVDSATAAEVAQTAIRLLGEAWKNGVTLVPGSQAGRALLVPGPALHFALRQWAGAGIPPAAVLEAATSKAAAALGAGDRIGRIAPGYDADLLLVNGDPTTDLRALDQISTVILKGERIDRADLLEVSGGE